MKQEVKDQAISLTNYLILILLTNNVFNCSFVDVCVKIIQIILRLLYTFLRLFLTSQTFSNVIKFFNSLYQSQTWSLFIAHRSLHHSTFSSWCFELFFNVWASHEWSDTRETSYHFFNHWVRSKKRIKQ